MLYSPSATAPLRRLAALYCLFLLQPFLLLPLLAAISSSSIIPAASAAPASELFDGVREKVIEPLSDAVSRAHEKAVDFADRARDLKPSTKAAIGVAAAGAALFAASRTVLRDHAAERHRRKQDGYHGAARIADAIDWDFYEKHSEESGDGGKADDQTPAAAEMLSPVALLPGRLPAVDLPGTPVSEIAPVLPDETVFRQQGIEARRRALIESYCSRWADRLLCATGIARAEPWVLDPQAPLETFLGRLPAIYMLDKTAPYLKTQLLENRLLSHSPKRIFAGLSRADESEAVTIETYSPLLHAQESHILSQIQFYKDVQGVNGFPQILSVYRQASTVTEWNLVFRQVGPTFHTALLLQAENLFTQATLINMFLHLFKALAKIHSLGVCHCSLTPKAILMPIAEQGRPLISDMDNHVRWSDVAGHNDAQGGARIPRTHCAASSSDFERSLRIFRRLTPGAKDNDVLPLCTVVDVWSLAQSFFVAAQRMHPNTRLEMAPRDEQNPKRMDVRFETLTDDSRDSVFGRVYYTMLDRLEDMAYTDRQNLHYDQADHLQKLDGHAKRLFKKVFTEESKVPSASEMVKLFATMQHRGIRFKLPQKQD